MNELGPRTEPMDPLVATLQLLVGLPGPVPLDEMIELLSHVEMEPTAERITRWAVAA